jgi:prophage DNA circulation protein
MSQFFPALLDKYTLNILDIEDMQSQNLAVHEFVNTDGAIVEQLGLRPHEIKFKTYFFGHDVQVNSTYISPTYANHFTFIDAMADTASSHDLTHPKYGKITGFVRSMTITHDDTQDYVEIEISFVEKDIQTLGFISDSNAIDQAVTRQQSDLLNAQLAASADSMNGSGFGAVLGKAVNFSQSLESQFTAVTKPVKDFLRQVDVWLGQLDTIESNITEPFQTVTNSVNFVNDVPSRILTSINSACNRVIGANSALISSPVVFMNNVTLGISNIVNTVTTPSVLRPHLLTLCAGSVAWQTGAVFQSDENNRATQAKLETTRTFDVKGNRIASVTYLTVMSVQDIEAVLYNTRALLQTAVEALRDANMAYAELVTMASTLALFVDTIKLKKRTVTTVTVNDMPLQVLLLQLGLPYNAFDRVLALNPQITCPSFITGDVKVYTV